MLTKVEHKCNQNRSCSCSQIWMQPDRIFLWSGTSRRKELRGQTTPDFGSLEFLDMCATFDIKYFWANRDTTHTSKAPKRIFFLFFDHICVLPTRLQVVFVNRALDPQDPQSTISLPQFLSRLQVDWNCMGQVPSERHVSSRSPRDRCPILFVRLAITFE